MPASLHTLPLSQPALPQLARWLHREAAGGDPADLAGALVLLPSQRACEQLRHALLEAAAGPALLLPWLTTPGRLAAELAALAGEAAADLPPADLRPLLLAPALAARPWLADRPEAAAGLAAELIAVFDDVRRAGRDDLILAGSDDEALLREAESGGEAVLEGDLARIREAWRLYRGILPADQVDLARAVVTRAADRWPGPLPTLVAAAHLGRLDAPTAGLLQRLSDQGVPVHWLTLEADAPRARLFLATYRDAASPVHPLAAAAELAEQVTRRRPEPPAFAGADLPTRLADLQTARAERGAAGPGGRVSCRDLEHEARVAAATVCESLAAADPTPRIIVASPDRDLAGRIAAHLRDAGVDVDDTRGRPLHTLPAGRLVRDLLRTVVGGWPFGTVFEVLTHPYVRLVDRQARPGHGVCVQLLEAEVRRARTARGGHDVLQRLARGTADRRPHPALGGFVDALAQALAPLASLGGGARPWPGFVAALREAWARLAPDRPLGVESDPRGDHDDLGAVDQLLADLDLAAPRLAAATLADQAAAVLERLRATEVRPRRQRHLPVRVMGLVEARLETADVLLLAGLAQDTFPGRLPRPLFLPDRVRRGLGLAHWRQKAGRDAELMLRLLGTAPRLVITWPREREGRPSLPSPLVQRLLMAAPDAPPEAPEPVAYRRRLPDLAAMVAAEQRHRAEPEPVPAPAVRRPSQLSHSALQVYRDCPYRFLMGNALGLRRQDPLEAEFSAADHGNLAHAVMQAWLAPDGAGDRALAAGDGRAAAAALDEAAAGARQRLGLELPGSEVALRALLSLAPDLVALELTRRPHWRPVALEAGFTVTLGQLADWLRGRGDDVPAAPADHVAYRFRGSIDRIDTAADGAPLAVVVDYKTGTPPTRSRVDEGRELQLALYAVAVEAGELPGLPAGARTVPEGAYYALRRQGFGWQARLDGGPALTRGVRTIYEQALAILDPARPFPLVPEWQTDESAGELPCRHCEFRGVCRLEERGTTPALAARVAALLAASPRSLS
ncbi:MAG: PD-(D/E)XK nuclease family protein [Candidatus Krumholzibacteriia bacterium]